MSLMLIVKNDLIQMCQLRMSNKLRNGVFD